MGFIRISQCLHIVTKYFRNARNIKTILKLIDCQSVTRSHTYGWELNEIFKNTDFVAVIENIKTALLN